tara:strand:+ start:4596 stop:4769 length:174 start_codon:yes stop_codon:yes gene_type:complete
MLLKLVSFLVAALFLIKIFQFLLKMQSNSKKTNIYSKKKNINIDDFKDAEFEEIDDK